jgi:hypothetical protein
MTGEPRKLRSRDEIFELDRGAWSLPEPRLQPVGPVHEVWPVHEKPRAETPAHEERPAAA